MNVPNQPLGHGWMSHEDLRARGPQCLPSDHAPLSPQSSVASSGSGGSEHLEDQTTARNTFQEEGSGMKAAESQLDWPGEELCDLLVVLACVKRRRDWYSVSPAVSFSLDIMNQHQLGPIYASHKPGASLEASVDTSWHQGTR
ncbi:hypothetical protein P7K49_018081 [Saguinus oedipus]|uniref:Uncharacterized protein n=1 Tax=Saguinus oedipus TaxID=9490 RepID=A0ABQ9V4I1_SAGOE|nr:hypothetical protein P7K49_018081 [Saguinus oedipus]